MRIINFTREEPTVEGAKNKLAIENYHVKIILKKILSSIAIHPYTQFTQKRKKKKREPFESRFS